MIDIIKKWSNYSKSNLDDYGYNIPNIIIQSNVKKKNGYSLIILLVYQVVDDKTFIILLPTKCVLFALKINRL